MKNQNGYSLIELIVMILLAGFILWGIITFTVQQVQNDTQMQELLKGYHLAEFYLERVKCMPYSATAVPVSCTGDSTDLPEFCAGWRRLADSTDQLEHIQIVVHHSGTNWSEDFVTLATYRQQNVTWGELVPYTVVAQGD